MLLVPRAPGLSTVDAPLSYMGLHIGTRMTVVKLADGTVLLHSPIELSPALRAEIDALGTVAHIVCPNAFHHLHAGPWQKAYSQAKLYGPKGLAKKRPDLRLDGATPSVADLEPVTIDGCLLEETVYVHAATKTVISSDLTENFVRPVDHTFTRVYLKLNGTYLKPGWPRVLRIAYRDKPAARRSIDRLLEHDFDRVLLAHGDVLDTGGKDAVRSTFEFLR